MDAQAMRKIVHLFLCCPTRAHSVSQCVCKAHTPMAKPLCHPRAPFRPLMWSVRLLLILWRPSLDLPMCPCRCSLVLLSVQQQCHAALPNECACHARLSCPFGPPSSCPLMHELIGLCACWVGGGMGRPRSCSPLGFGIR